MIYILVKYRGDEESTSTTLIRAYIDKYEAYNEMVELDKESDDHNYYGVVPIEVV